MEAQLGYRKWKSSCTKALTCALELAAIRFNLDPSPTNADLFTAASQDYNVLLRDRAEFFAKKFQLERDLVAELPDAFKSSLLRAQSTPVIHSLSLDGHIHSGDDVPRIITREFRKIFQKKRCHTPSQDLLLSPSLAKLSPSQSSSLASPLSVMEILEAFLFNPTKAPGGDGLGGAFYSLFRDVLAPVLLLVYEDFLGPTCTAASKSEFLYGLVAPVPKKVSAIKDFSHIRPISLLNLDYKILSKVLAGRIKPVMSSLVGADQTGYIPGRFILSNSVALDLMLKQSPAIHLFVDFTKAFDSVQHSWIHKVLEAQGFPPSFVSWIKSIQSNNVSAFHFNNTTHEEIGVHSGVRQGDPVAGFLFDLAIEPLAHAIRSHPDIHPALMSPSFGKSVGLHVDDIWISVKDVPSASLASHLLDTFCLASGMEVNHRKSYTLNQLSGDLFGLSPIPATGFKHLGLPVGPKGFYFDASSHLERAQSTVSKLGNLHLSLMGRKRLVHSYVFSPLIYQLYVLTPPTLFLDKFTKVSNGLLWGGRARVRGSLLFQSTDHLGIDLWSLKERSKALKSSLLLRLCRDGGPVAGALDELYASQASNLSILPADAILHRVSPWTSTSIHSLPPPTSKPGGYLVNPKDPEQCFHLTPGLPLRKVVSLPDGSLSVGAVTLSVPKYLLPLRVEEEKRALWSLSSLLAFLYPTSPPPKLLPLRYIYSHLLSKAHPPVPPSRATVERLSLFNLSIREVKGLWSSPIRHGIKSFMFLWVKNSNPIQHGKTCSLCAGATLDQRHLWQSCPVTKPWLEDIPSSPSLVELAIPLWATWLTYCHYQNQFLHNFTPTPIINQLHTSILEAELARHEASYPHRFHLG